MHSQLFKYYDGEEESPFPKDDVRSRFWWGEMMYSKDDHSFVDWTKEGQIWLQEASEEIKQLARYLRRGYVSMLSSFASYLFLTPPLVIVIS